MTVRYWNPTSMQYLPFSDEPYVEVTLLSNLKIGNFGVCDGSSNEEDQGTEKKGIVHRRGRDGSLNGLGQAA